MKPKLSAFFHFNKTLLIINIPISYSCIYVQQYYNMQGFFIWPIWFKLMSYPVVYYLAKYLRERDFDFYRNQELSPANLYLFSFSIDYLVFLIIIYTIQ